MAPTRQLEAAPADVEETSEALVACEVGKMLLKTTIFATYKILESQGIFFLLADFFLGAEIFHEKGREGSLGGK